MHKIRGRKPVFSIGHLTETKISWIIFALCFLLIPVLFIPGVLFALDYVTSRGEVRFAERDTAQVISLFKSKQDSMSRSLHDWSAWDDTYQFVQDGNQQYIDDNLSGGSLLKLGIEIVVFLDRSGRVVYSNYTEFLDNSDQTDQLNLAQLLATYPQLTKHADLESVVSGYGMVDGKAMLLVSRPVITSQYQGPIEGTILFGMMLGEDEMADLTHLVQKEIGVVVAEQGHQPKLFDEIARAVKNGDKAYIQPGKGDFLTSSFFLTDMNGENHIALQVKSNRALSTISNIASLVYRGIIMAFGLVLFFSLRPLALNYLRSYRSYQEYLNRFLAVVEQSREAILLVDENWRIIEANGACKQLLGWMPNSTVPISLGGYLICGQKFDRPFLIQICNDGKLVELHCVRRDGVKLEIEISGSTISTITPVAYSIILRDITQRKEIETELKTSQERYQLATRGAKDGLWDWNLMSNSIYYSSRWKAMLGYSREEIQDTPEEWTSRIHAEDAHIFQTTLYDHLNKPTDHFQCEHRLRMKDGSYRWMLARGVAVWTEEGYAYRMAGSLTDIDDRRRMEEQLRFDALHDGLTGLANRTLILDHVRHVNERKKRRPEMVFALFFLDLDRFKQINDTLGHGAGDQVLIEVSRRMESGLRAGDTIARFSGPETLARIAGDEFVILLEDFNHPEDAFIVAERMLYLLRQPVQINGGDVVNIGASIGVVVPEAAYENVEDLLRDADIAMYQAKKNGRDNVVLFTSEMYHLMADRMQLENELRCAVDRKEFSVFYQPIFSLVDDRLVGFEALMRWNHPQRGLLLPAEFLDIAEETGLIIPIGYYVFEESCRQMVAWQKQYQLPAEITVSVNLSARQLVADELVQFISQTLEESGFAPQSLWLEITESYLVKNMETIQSTLDALRVMGIRIEIDDFGSGYSSFNLHTLHVDGYKIDRSYIQDTGHTGQQLLKNLVSIGQNLGLTQVAEGVESSEQKDYLKSLSCAYGQGYLMARPLNAAQVAGIIQEQDWGDPFH
jgi:diguanylate cyclase (GGDEF)-like protein/PAS domain S-box-containing protein